MKYVYLVLHKRSISIDTSDPVFSTKIIGFYSSKEKATTVIERYKSIEGFKNYPNDFIIEEYKIDFDDYTFE